MEIYAEILELNEVKYINRGLRWLIACLLGITMVYISEPGHWAQLHQYDGYLLAIGISCAIAIGLSKLINYTSIWLDKKVTWVTSPLRRLVLQLCFGVILPIGLAVAAIGYYFDANSLALNQTTYFTRVFYPVCLLLLLVNAYYPLHFYIQLNRYLRAQQTVTLKKEHLIAQQQQEAIIEVLPGQQLEKSELNLPVPYQIVDIVLVMSIDRVLVWFSNANEKLLWHTSIDQTIKLLPLNNFYKINKSGIVARANIAQAFHHKSNTIELLLKVPEAKIVIVSQREASAFAKWYAERIFPERPKKALPQVD